MTNESAGAVTQVAQQIPERFREHNLTLVSAGVAFYAFLAFVPALIVIVAVYGLVAEPAHIQRQVRDFAGALPDEVQRFIQQQITSIGSASGAGVSITLVIAVAVALWSASGAMAALVTGVNVARDQTEPKSFVKKRAKALALTFGAVVLLVVMMFLIAALPSILVDAGLGTAGRVVFNILHWPVLAIVMVIGLGVLYRVAVERPKDALFGVVNARHAGGHAPLARRVGVVRGVHSQLCELQRDLRVIGVDRGGAAVALPQRAGGADRRRGRRRHELNGSRRRTTAAGGAACKPRLPAAQQCTEQPAAS